TYDYFFNQHNRNSIDGNGFKLLSYVHYNTNYNNAFWDGQRMTYGDGNGSTFTILTALDVCGHEITHGLTSNTSGLIYSYESGALNESYSDIFGTLVENYGRPSNWDWKIGQDMTPSGNGIRNMQNPKLFSDPHTYQGQYWYTGTNDNGGVHTNSGVSNYWFYCLSAGATGTNDISNSYTVNSIGMINAARIAFRANTIYYTPSTNYANARILSIQAAKDLFGACSNEVIETTNAWYAVGVGAAYSPAAINPDFDANATNLCNIPAQVSFNNNTANGVTYTWDFGDNSALSTSTNPVHSYTANGVYAVKLKAVGCQSLSDSITKTAYITVNAPSAPTAIGDKVCQSGVMTLTASGSGNLNWYSNSTLTNLVNSGTVYTTPNLSNSTTYYVVNSVPNAPAFGGIPNNVNGGFLTNSAHYLIFDVAESGTLQSVVVYANSAGNRTFELRNSSSAVLSSTVINLSVGANTINLNFPLTPGSAYQLGLSGSSASDMYRTNSNTNYPYNVGGFVSITGSSAGNSYYYWSYNWKVQKEDCKSGATPVTATVNPNPAIQFNLSSSEVCRQSGTVNLSASPAGGTFSGNGVSGNSFDPAVGTGTFMVYYNVTDGNGCNGNDSIVMTVADCTGLNEINSVVSNMVIYPNPSSGNIYLQNAFIEGIELSYELTDAIGRVIIKNVINSKNYLINASELSNGIYFITLKQEDQKLKTIKFIKQ
ncbi:MAG: M4 family metallopeptidase, partial [Bacteroidia bacterium]